MTSTAFAPYTMRDLRSAFATRRSTPEAVVVERATAARRLRVGLFSPAEIRRQVEWNRYLAAQETRDAEIERAATAWFVANQDRMVYIVGTNHDTPVAAYLNGTGNVRLCEDPACCAGVLETDEQRLEREAVWALHPGLATSSRHAFPELRV